MSDSTPNRYPPTDGSIPAFSGTLDWQTEHNPSATWVIFPYSPSRRDGTSESQPSLRSISVLQFSQASHRVAHALRPERKGPEGEVVALLLHCDTIHYGAAIAGCIRAGLVPFPMSPRNSPEAVVNMMEKTSCHRILSQKSLTTLLDSVQALLRQKNYSVEVLELPPLLEIFPSLSQDSQEADTVIPYPRSSMKHRPDDLVIYLHSSGSTGFPKPIPLTQKIANQWMSETFVRQNRARKIRYGLMSLPTFHALGFIFQFISPLVGCVAWVAFEPRYPAPPVVPTPQNMLEVARMADCDGLVCVPTFVEAFCESEESTAYLKTLKVLVFGGGPLSTSTGRKLDAAGIRASTCYGGTEWGACTQIFDDSHPTDPLALKAGWGWLAFSPEFKLRWVDQGDGSFELHFLTCEVHQPSVENLPDVKGYATSDLFVRHSTHPDLWRIIGRADDVITLGSGEKIVPLAQENFLSTRPSIQGAVMFGRARNEPGILLEPRPEFAFDPANVERLAEFRNQIWPYVEEANKLGPTFAKIFKEMIIVTRPDKPMGRASKGTVQRKQVLSSYEKEIEQLYETIQGSKESHGITPPEEWSVSHTTNWLLEHAKAINNGTAPSATTDFFEQGFDSLSATYLRHRILGALGSSTDPSANEARKLVPQDFIFTNPSIAKLAQAIIHLIKSATKDYSHDSLDELNLMITKYCTELPSPSASRLVLNRDAPLVVLLTGSTGGLGSHLLAQLLEDARVGRVYTLDRGVDIKNRLRNAFEDRGISTEGLGHSKLRALTADLGQPGFGIGADVLREMKQSLTHIIHNAWKVDFNLSLSSFEPNVLSTRHLLEFCSSCDHAVRFIFCSSISSASRWDVSKGLVPEEVLDPELTGVNGYAKSKYVAERMLSNAAKLGYLVTILRLGQIAGSASSGAWSTSDWVPILVKSSVTLGCLPDLHGDVSWFSTDTVCGTVLDILTSDDPTPIPELINVVHPRPRAWREIMMDINSALRPNNPLPLIPLDKWVSKVESQSVHPTERDLQTVPAVKILHFLHLVIDNTSNKPSPLNVDAEGVPKYDSTKAQRISPALRNAKPLSREDVKMWVTYWRSKGFVE